MKWLLIADEIQNKDIKQFEEYFYSNGIEFDEVFVETDKNTRAFADDLVLASNATHCIVFSLEKLLHVPDFTFLLGLVFGKEIMIFVTEKNQHVEMVGEFEKKCGGSIRGFSSPEELLGYISSDMDEIRAESDARESLISLMTMGIPFTADSLAHYIEKDKDEICDKLLSAGICVDAFTSEGVPLLCVAARSDNPGKVRWLIEHGADVNIVSKDRGYSPVMDAVWRKDFETAKILIEHKADLGIMSSDGQPIMVLAVGNGDEKIVQLLVDSGADPDVKDSMGMSARGYARLFKKEALVRIMEKIPEKTEQ